MSNLEQQLQNLNINSSRNTMEEEEKEEEVDLNCSEELDTAVIWTSPKSDETVYDEDETPYILEDEDTLIEYWSQY